MLFGCNVRIAYGNPAVLASPGLVLDYDGKPEGRTLCLAKGERSGSSGKQGTGELGLRLELWARQAKK